jgi:hypothetical protein
VGSGGAVRVCRGRVGQHGRAAGGVRDDAEGSAALPDRCRARVLAGGSRRLGLSLQRSAARECGGPVGRGSSRGTWWGGLLAGLVRRGRVQLRRRPLLRFNGGQAPQHAHRWYGCHPAGWGLLARFVRRWRVQFRWCPLFRFHGGPAPRDAHRWYGCRSGRAGLLVGRVRWRRVQFRGHSLPRLAGRQAPQLPHRWYGGHPGRAGILARIVQWRRVQLR